MRHLLRACRGKAWGLSWSARVMPVRCISWVMHRPCSPTCRADGQSVHWQAVAIGACQHPDAPVCARCCLRQRLCYQVNRCPLCNTSQEEVGPSASWPLSYT